METKLTPFETKMIGHIKHNQVKYLAALMTGVASVSYEFGRMKEREIFKKKFDEFVDKYYIPEDSQKKHAI